MIVSIKGFEGRIEGQEQMSCSERTDVLLRDIYIFGKKGMRSKQKVNLREGERERVEGRGEREGRQRR